MLMSNLRQSAASNVLTVTSEDDGVPEEYCDICRLDQPPLTSHCRTCNTCIMK